MIIGAVLGVALFLVTVALVSRPSAQPQSIKVERPVNPRIARRTNRSGRY